jgi:BON domain-containing protein
MYMRRYFWVVLVSLAVAAGCNRGTRPDGQLAADVQTKIQADNAVPDKQLTINATNGVVTLSGNVSSDAARNAAANDAAQVEGVKTVVNNLQVTPAVTQNAEPEPPAREEASRPSPRKPYSAPKRSSGGGDSGLRTTVPPTSASSGGNAPADTYNQTPSTPPPAAAPQPVTVPAGTQISIRLNDELNSEKAQIGDVFHASISTPIQIDGRTVVPTTADVEGRVVEVKSAGRFAGQSDLVIELTRLQMNGKSYTLATDRWSKQGSSRGKATAAKVGGGAAVGAIIGGIVGGGKGAAIGAAAGAGAGTGVSAATKGQQIILKPETVLNFQLQNPISVVPAASRQAMN